MSNVFFRANNKVGSTWSFQTNMPSGNTFSPKISGGDIPIWDLGDGNNYQRGSSIFYTYLDSGSTKTVTMRGDVNMVRDKTTFISFSDNIVGKLDMSGWDSLGNVNPLTLFSFSVNSNPELTGITHTEGSYPIKNYRAYSCDLTGTLDLSMIQLKDGFQVSINPNLTEILHSANTEVMITYLANDCDLTGNHDMTAFHNLEGVFRVHTNPNLTGITHIASSGDFTHYEAYNCDLTGVLDLSMLTGFGGDFNVSNNPNLTNILHTASTNSVEDYVAYNNIGLTHLDLSMVQIGGAIDGGFQVFSCSNLTAITHFASTNVISNYSIYSNDIIGNHDVSMFPNMKGSFNIDNNLSLTGITHTTSLLGFTTYTAQNCDLTGTHDMSMIHELGNISIYLNDNLSIITHTGSTTPGYYSVFNCDLIGSHDISMLSGRTNYVKIDTNPSLTGILFGPSSEIFKNGNSYYAFDMGNCNLGYVDFNPFSAATMDTGSTHGATISVRNNTMPVADVNHMLVDFDKISTENPTGWSGVVLKIDESNAAPDGSSGGYNGTGATVNLIAKGWTVTTS